MARTTEPQQDRKRATTHDNGATANNAPNTKYVPIPDDEFEALLKEGIEKYDAIWKSLADK